MRLAAHTQERNRTAGARGRVRCGAYRGAFLLDHLTLVLLRLARPHLPVDETMRGGAARRGSGSIDGWRQRQRQRHTLGHNTPPTHSFASAHCSAGGIAGEAQKIRDKKKGETTVLSRAPAALHTLKVRPAPGEKVVAEIARGGQRQNITLAASTRIGSNSKQTPLQRGHFCVDGQTDNRWSSKRLATTERHRTAKGSERGACSVELGR